MGALGNMFYGITFLDVVAVVIIGTSLFAALKRGLTGELISVASTVTGLVLALHFYERGVPLMIELRFPEGPVSELAAFLLIFLTTFLLGTLLRIIVFRTVKVLHLRWADRFLGGLFGTVKGWLITSTVFLSLTAFPLAGDLVTRSKTAEFFLTSARMLLQIAPADFRERFSKEHQRIYQIWKSKTRQIHQAIEDGRELTQDIPERIPQEAGTKSEESRPATNEKITTGVPVQP